MEGFNEELKMETVEGRLEFGFWAKVWDGIMWVLRHITISGSGSIK